MKSKFKIKLIVTSIVLVLSVFLFSEKSSAQLFWDQAAYFDGTGTGYISTMNSSSLNITGSFTIEMWINPSNSTSPANQILIQKRNTAANGYTVLLTNGKVAIKTNNVTRLIGTIVIPNNEWTHIAARYNSSNSNYSIYINGELDNSGTAASSSPASNTDSLWIAKGSNNPFKGFMDNIRIWDTAITPTQLLKFYRSIIACNSGKYSSLVLSLPFQQGNSAGVDFTIDDKTDYNQQTVNRGVTAVDLSSRPSVTTFYNESIYLDGMYDYVSGGTNAVSSPVSEITLEAWIYPEDTYVNSEILICKGFDAAIYSARYCLYLNYFSPDFFTINAVINGNTNYSTDPIGRSYLSGWSHIAFTYSSISGKYEFFMNGSSFGVGINNQGAISSFYTDSLFLGNNFEGNIDEVRISDKVKDLNSIQKNLFTSIDNANDSSSINEAVYNFDGYMTSSAESTPKLNFRNTAGFSNSTTIADKPISPLIRSTDFPKGFYIKRSFDRIPENTISTDGILTDDLIVNEIDSITDINVFIALNHTQENSLRIVLISPDNDSCILFNQNEFSSEADNIITIFDDQADSSLSDLNRYVSITPKIRPYNNLNSNFSNTKTHGVWRLKIYDFYLGDIGNLYSWGIQINNHPAKRKIFSAVCFMQGFYNAVSNTTIRDTVKCTLRSISSPYSIVAAAKSFQNSGGYVDFDFTNTAAKDNVYYFVQINHRNSIEIWNSILGKFEYLFGSYYMGTGWSYITYFGFNKTYVYGTNEILIDTSPTPRYGLYSGDVNQDGTIDLADGSLIDNDALNFASGYVPSDVNGDGTVDLSDGVYADNNGFNFVSKITP